MTGDLAPNFKFIFYTRGGAAGKPIGLRLDEAGMGPIV